MKEGKKWNKEIIIEIAIGEGLRADLPVQEEPHEDLQIQEEIREDMFIKAEKEN